MSRELPTASSDEITFKMREADLGRDDHYSITDPASDPRFFFNWTRSPACP